MNKRQKIKQILAQLWQLFQHYCRKYPANALSVSLHLVLLILAVIFIAPGVSKLYRTVVPINPTPTPPIIEASVVSSQAVNQAVNQRLDQIKQRREDIARKQEAAHEAKIAAARRAREAKLAKQKALEQKRAQEKKREQEKKRLEAQRRADAEKKRQQQEKEKQQKLKQLQQAALDNLKKLQQQQQAQQAERAKTIIEKYIGLIQTKITSNWIQPQNVSSNNTVVLKIALDASGNVISVEVVQSSGSRAFDRQAILAVQKSSPLPLPDEDDLKNKFRVLTLPFTP